MKEISVKVHEISKDGLPPEDYQPGTIAFLWDGQVVSGWPCRDGLRFWEANDIGRPGRFDCVTHWVEFPCPIWDLERASQAQEQPKLAPGECRPVEVEGR